MAAKTVDSKTNGFPADKHAPFGKKIFNIGCAQSKPMVDSNRISNNLTRKTKTLKVGKSAW